MPKLASKGAPRRQRRLSLRVTEQERLLIEQAAWLTSSGDVTRFVMSASVSAAQETIEDHEVTRVSGELRRSLYDLLLHPPPPGAALQKLAKNPVPPDLELVDE